MLGRGSGTWGRGILVPTHPRSRPRKLFLLDSTGNTFQVIDSLSNRYAISYAARKGSALDGVQVSVASSSSSSRSLLSSP